MTLYSRELITQVFQLFDRHLREEYRARPHLGKKTSADANDLKDLYKDDWEEFNRVRKEIDPDGKFRPANNELLHRLFPAF